MCIRDRRETEQQIWIGLVQAAQGLLVDGDGLQRLALSEQFIGIALTARDIAAAAHFGLESAQVLLRIERFAHAPDRAACAVAAKQGRQHFDQHIGNRSGQRQQRDGPDPKCVASGAYACLLYTSRA